MIDLSHASVMCVDDDPVIRSVVRSALQQHGCQDVVQANGGAQALNFCVGRDFDLVICDFQMAPMTGLDFLRALANVGLGHGWPVIMLSAETDPETIQSAKELGVRAWVHKPISVRELVEHVARVLRPGGTSAAISAELQADAERRHVRLLTALARADDALRGLELRGREAAALAQAIRAPIEDARVNAHALQFDLVSVLAGRAADLLGAMARNPAATAHNLMPAVNALGTLVTAMRQVARNRVAGDGGQAGARLLSAIDGVMWPVLASLAATSDDAGRRSPGPG